MIKKYKAIIFHILVLITFLFLDLLIRKTLLLFFELEEPEIIYLHFVSRLIIAIGLIIYVAKLNIVDFKKILKNNFLVILSILFAIWLIHFDSFKMFSDIDSQIITFFYATQSFLGIFEEVGFRVLVFASIYGLFFKEKNYSNSSQLLLSSVLLTSILFSFVHSINIFKLINAVGFERALFSVSNQLVFAFAMGYVFSLILFYSKNIIFIGLTHGFVNFFGSYKVYFLISQTQNNNNGFIEKIIVLLLFMFLAFVVIQVCKFILKTYPPKIDFVLTLEKLH